MLGYFEDMEVVSVAGIKQTGETVVEDEVNGQVSGPTRLCPLH